MKNRYKDGISNYIGCFSQQCCSLKTSTQPSFLWLPESWHYGQATPLTGIFPVPEKPLAQRQISIILAGDLCLYSNHELPADLSLAEVHQFFLNQFESATQLEDHATLFDYFLVKKSVDKSLYAAYQARKQTVLLINNAVGMLGLTPLLLVPEQAIVLNDVLQSASLESDKQLVLYSLVDAVYAFELFEGNLVDAHYISQFTQNSSEKRLEWLSSLLADKYKNITLMGFTSADLQSLLSQQGLNFDDRSRSLNLHDERHSHAISNEHIMGLMEQQYVLYQSIALA